MALQALSTQILAALCAAISGGLAGSWFVKQHLRKRAQQKRAQQMRASGEAALGENPEDVDYSFRSLGFAAELSRGLTLHTATALTSGLRLGFVEEWFSKRKAQAGSFAQAITSQGFVEASARMALLSGALGAVFGCLFSTELAVLAGIAGFAWGLTAPARDMRAAIKLRTVQLSRDLPEMLEVVALGLRSGLSFDRSLALYIDHFASAFSAECERAMQKWTMGLATREEALREMAMTYDSALLSRVVEGMVRSLRFGSSLVDLLEQAAVEARADHRAVVEERVAKAPVKMMIPTGTLILPAMLLLVLGPVLLELMGGF